MSRTVRGLVNHLQLNRSSSISICSSHIRCSLVHHVTAKPIPRIISATLPRLFSAATSLSNIHDNITPHIGIPSQTSTDSDDMPDAVYDTKTLKESNAKTFKSLGSKLQAPFLDALNDMGYE